MTSVKAAYKRVEERCPDCNSVDLVEDHAAGDLICTGCGRVVGERMIDTSSEWRTFSNDNAPTKDKSRVGAAEDIMGPGISMTTNIGTGKGSRDGAASLARIQNKATVNQNDKMLKDGAGEIHKLIERLQLNKRIQDTANRYFLAAVKEGTKARTEALAAASVFIACRKEGYPRTFKDIAKNTSVPVKDLGRAYQQLRKIVKLDTQDRYCDNLNLNHLRRFAAHVSDRAYETNILGGRPQQTVAACALYFTSQLTDDKRSMKEIGDAVGVAEGTVKTCYKIFLEHAADLVKGVEEEFLSGHTLDELPPV